MATITFTVNDQQFIDDLITSCNEDGITPKQFVIRETKSRVRQYRMEQAQPDILAISSDINAIEIT